MGSPVLHHLPAMSEVVLAHSATSSSEGGDNKWFGLLCLLGGPAFYMYMYTRYRNTNKRYHHETETAAEVANLQSVDQCVGHVDGSTSSQMSGRNEHEVRG